MLTGPKVDLTIGLVSDMWTTEFGDKLKKCLSEY